MLKVHRPAGVNDDATLVLDEKTRLRQRIEKTQPPLVAELAEEFPDG
ncbi:MAG: hypothetical protein NTY98_22410 [Verrucomicrobia bacterium]|nr:hypothetical protein [Verrucomicrobiota bacterium]